jgi:hypothetical protein
VPPIGGDTEPVEQREPEEVAREGEAGDLTASVWKDAIQA